MGFLTGLLLGVVVGISSALTVAPAKGEETRGRAREALSQAAKGECPFSLQGIVDSVREQVGEAMGEARKVARETEEELKTPVRGSADD